MTAATIRRPPAESAAELTGWLGLAHPPVGLAFVADPPAQVPVRTDVAPSACTLWRMAEREPFFVPAAGHLGCPVGAAVLGVPLDADARARLAATVVQMTGSGYLSEAEAAALPTRHQATAGVCYGPLADLPVPPDLVVVWVTPRAAMLLGEATGGASWTGAGGLTVTGRPGCAALPRAEDSRSVTASWGCTGMRRFTAIPDDLLLAVLPGPPLDRLVDALAATVAANTDMAAFYAAGPDPSAVSADPSAASDGERPPHPPEGEVSP